MSESTDSPSVPPVTLSPAAAGAIALKRSIARWHREFRRYFDAFPDIPNAEAVRIDGTGIWDELDNAATSALNAAVEADEPHGNDPATDPDLRPFDASPTEQSASAGPTAHTVATPGEGARPPGWHNVDGSTLEAVALSQVGPKAATALRIAHDIEQLHERLLEAFEDAGYGINDEQRRKAQCGICNAEDAAIWLFGKVDEEERYDAAHAEDSMGHIAFHNQNPSLTRLEAIQVLAGVAHCSSHRRGDYDGRLVNVNFSGLDLSGFGFENIDLRRAKFRGCKLVGSLFYGALLDDADFSGADLRKAEFNDASIMRAKFFGANLQAAVLEITDGEQADFGCADLTRCDLSGSMLGHASFRKANLTGARFHGAILGRNDWTDATIQGGDWREITKLGATGEPTPAPDDLPFTPPAYDDVDEPSTSASLEEPADSTVAPTVAPPAAEPAEGTVANG